MAVKFGGEYEDIHTLVELEKKAHRALPSRWGKGLSFSKTQANPNPQ